MEKKILGKKIRYVTIFSLFYHSRNRTVEMTQLCQMFTFCFLESFYLSYVTKNIVQMIGTVEVLAGGGMAW